VVSTKYDVAGRKARETAPHNLAPGVLGRFVAGDWLYAEALAGTQYAYDAWPSHPGDGAGRGGDQRQYWAQSGGEVTCRTIDPNGHVRDALSDPFGRLSRVVEFTGTYPYPSPYATTITSTMGGTN